MANINSVNGIALGGQTASITLPSLNTFNDKYGTYDNKVTHPDDMEMFRVDAGGQNNVQQVVPRKVSWLDKIIRFFKYMFSTDTTMKATSRAFFDDVSRMFNGKIPPNVMTAMGKHCKEDGVEEPVLLSQVRNVQTLASQALDRAQRQAIMNNEEFRHEMRLVNHIKSMNREQKEEFIRTEKDSDAHQKKDIGVKEDVVYKETKETLKQVFVKKGFLDEDVPHDKETSENTRVPDNKKTSVNPESSGGLSKTAKKVYAEKINHGNNELNTQTEIRPSFSPRFNRENTDVDTSVVEGEVDNLNVSKYEYKNLSRDEYYSDDEN